MRELSELSEKFHQSIFQSLLPDISAFVNRILTTIHSNRCSTTAQISPDTFKHQEKRQKTMNSEYDSLVKSFQPLPVPTLSNSATESQGLNVFEQLVEKLCSEFIDLPDNTDFDGPQTCLQDFIDDLLHFQYEHNNKDQENEVDLRALVQFKYEGTKHSSMAYYFFLSTVLPFLNLFCFVNFLTIRSHIEQKKT